MQAYARKRGRTNSRLYPGVLLILALILRAVVPEGFMPSMGKAGMGHMMICPGMAAMEHGDAGGKDQKNGAHSNCAYAPVLAQGLAGYVPVIEPAPVQRDIVSIYLAVFSPDLVTVKPWRSRGPPSFLTLT